MTKCPSKGRHHWYLLHDMEWDLQEWWRPWEGVGAGGGDQWGKKEDIYSTFNNKDKFYKKMNTSADNPQSLYIDL